MSVLDVERDGAVLLLTLNRPAQRNAFDRALADALSAALDELDDDPSLHVGILAANGPAFSAGTDLHEPASPATSRGGEYGVVRRRRATPLIAAVEGPAYGGGFEVVLACDLVVAGRDARFGLPEVARGLAAVCGALFRAPDRLPPAVATELLLTGDPIDATRAYEVGLVNRLVDAGGAAAAARELAERILRNSPDAVATTLRAVQEARGPAESVGWTATDAAAARVAGSPDRVEGVTAFFEKRAPRWSR
ncbi:enoyl-CoA hydratase-related protein [Nocardioides nitrophenolicus]|uniref:enoyl-CoA hydratase-related protein n=1 Tax=Nocardioides nitrophenolicus TaxID=60489 RepID=UPI0027DE6CFB|nr:enoyl-CoA hydratase-related protein [Nocardioides nitrophenolicus]MBM7516440.1 enoyl-CoA hydratase/carnithine racemase [Nocardioides nitrophenolicus]